MKAHPQVQQNETDEKIRFFEMDARPYDRVDDVLSRARTDGMDQLGIKGALVRRRMTTKKEARNSEAGRRRATNVNDVQRHGNGEQQNGQRTLLFGRRMYALELQSDDDESRSNSSNTCGRFRSVKGAHGGAGRLVSQPMRRWLPVGGATTMVRCTRMEVVPDDRRSQASRDYLRHMELLSTVVW